jgi:hypothetical protein
MLKLDKDIEPMLSRHCYQQVQKSSMLENVNYKSISSRLRPPRPNPAVIIAGLDENQAWGAPNFQPDPQLYARKSAFLTYFYK